MERRFNGMELRHVPRRENFEADELSRLTSSRAPLPLRVFEERLSRPSTAMANPDAVPPLLSGEDEIVPPSEALALLVESRERSWMDDIHAFQLDKTLPEDDVEAEKVIRRSKCYILVDGDLYRRGKDGMSLCCITREEGGELLADIHEGECGSHSSSRTMVGKAFRQGFYWPTALEDATKLVRHCRACQFHANQIHQPAQALNTIPL